jgi:hypothetical protein
MVVRFIDRTFEPAQRQQDGQLSEYRIHKSERGSAEALLQMVDAIPPHLVAMPGDKFVGLLSAIAELRVGVGAWNAGHGYEVIRTPGAEPTENPVTVIRRTLCQCPDEGIREDTPEFPFLCDVDLERTLRLDLAAAHSAASGGAWKAATILAGSTLEALLMSAVGKASEAAHDALEAATDSVLRMENPPPRIQKPYTDWTLAELIPVARMLCKLSRSCVTACDQTREYRNLIHPGRAIRLGAKCSQGTAYTALGAVHLLAEELSRE